MPLIIIPNTNLIILYRNAVFDNHIGDVNTFLIGAPDGEISKANPVPTSSAHIHLDNCGLFVLDIVGEVEHELVIEAGIVVIKLVIVYFLVNLAAVNADVNFEGTGTVTILTIFAAGGVISSAASDKSEGIQDISFRNIYNVRNPT